MSSVDGLELRSGRKATRSVRSASTTTTSSTPPIMTAAGRAPSSSGGVTLAVGTTSA